MFYAASSEVTSDVGAAVRRLHKSIDPVLREAFGRSGLSSVEGKLIYVPIVMHFDLHEEFKERSRFVARARTYECCPQLDYEVFLNGTFEQTVEEYFRGLALAAPHLHQLGATEAQVAEFLSILDHARERALAEPGVH